MNIYFLDFHFIFMRLFNLKFYTIVIYIEMNKTLPIELINLIFSYMSSPVAEIFENETNYINYSYYEL